VSELREFGELLSRALVPNAGARLKKGELAHVPAKWIRFADKDMRQHENLKRFPVILDHSVIQYDREAL
jgi:hypothetical protein